MAAELHPVPLDTAVAAIDALVSPLMAESVALAEADGRVLAADLGAAAPIPEADQALVDGFAVRAEATLGAAAYNPVELPRLAVAAGAELPPGADAVVALDAADLGFRGHIAVVDAVAPGANVVRRGAAAAAGAVLVTGGTRLSARHLGLIAAAGIERLPVIGRPRVAMLLVGIAASGVRDSNSPMLRSAVVRDGGVVGATAVLPRDRPAIAAALTAAADILLVAGGSGPGPDDHAAAALAEIGELAFHGVALHPGETAGGGRTGNGVPVLLLPGMPADCLWGYELLAGRAIRRLGGRDPAPPYCVRALRLRQKIVSTIGTTEVCPIRLAPDDAIEPLPSFAEIGLGAAARASGFVVVPASSEGYPPGEVVSAYLYEA